MRKEQTKQEKTFWNYLRKGEFAGLRFRRQYSIGGFVIDFYCPSLKLAIEIDGSIHDSQVKYDKFRQSGIETLGIRFLRFANDEIDNEFGKVMKIVRETSNQSPHPGLPFDFAQGPRPPLSLPRRGDTRGKVKRDGDEVEERSILKIIEEKISRKEIAEKYLTYFDTMTKAVVDIGKEVMAVDADLHSDLESALLETGSIQENLWGINLYPLKNKEDFIEYTSLINIRPHQNNTSMEIEDPHIRERVKSTVDKLVDYGP